MGKPEDTWGEKLWLGFGPYMLSSCKDLVKDVSCHGQPWLDFVSWHRRVPQPEGPTDVPLQLRNIRVEAKTAIKYLGVWLKATELIAALSSIAGSTWETNTLHLRSMYTAVLFHRIAFACSVWYVRGGYGFKGVENEVRRTLESIQFRALYRIAGAFRTTSRAALEVSHLQ
jgi:hypothetical protein